MVESYDPEQAYPRNVIERLSTLELNYKLLNSEEVYSLDVIKNADRCTVHTRTKGRNEEGDCRMPGKT